MAPIAARVSAALLAGLLAPAAAVQIAAGEKTVLTGFDLGEFVSGLMQGAAGNTSIKGLDRIQECSKLAVDIRGVKGALNKIQGEGMLAEGIKDMIHEIQVTGPEFQGCKHGLKVTARTMKAMFHGSSRAAEPPGLLATVQSWATPVMHFSELKKLAGSAAASLKAGEYKDAGASMGKILKVAGWADLEPEGATAVRTEEEWMCCVCVQSTDQKDWGLQSEFTYVWQRASAMRKVDRFSKMAKKDRTSCRKYKNTFCKTDIATDKDLDYEHFDKKEWCTEE